MSDNPVTSEEIERLRSNVLAFAARLDKQERFYDEARFIKFARYLTKLMESLEAAEE